MFQKINKSLNRIPFFVRLLHWEYWNFNLVYIPVAFYFTYLAIRARSFFFFSASNPTIETGGMFGESKWEIFKLIPKQYFPATILIRENTTTATALTQINDAAISFPLIAKPDRGERGWKVERIHTPDQLAHYMAMVKVDFLIQQLVEYPIELSVFYFRFPNEPKGKISSVVVKEMLQVTGNGTSTLRELICDYPRALLQLKVLEKEFKEKLNDVPIENEIVVLVPIGNHSRGAMFIDRCDIVDEEMITTFDNISQQIDGFYFGRYDLRCKDIDTMKLGRDIQILELNGAGAEPAHIYHPGFSLCRAYRVLFYHFKVLYKISLMNHKAGTSYMSFKEYRAFQKMLNNYRSWVTP